MDGAIFRKTKPYQKFQKINVIRNSQPVIRNPKYRILPITDHRSPITYLPLAPGSWKLGTGYRVLVTALDTIRSLPYDSSP